MTPIIAFVNHKGGSGKTTTAYHITKHWSANDIRTLAVDLDSQCTLTRRLYPMAECDDPTIADLLASTMQRTTLSAYDCVQDFDGWSLLPADRRISWIAAKMQSSSPNHNILARALQPLAAHFDAIILDCPPSADITIINALVAATHIVICATPTPESWDGQQSMRTMLADLHDSLGHAPALLGLLATQVIERTLLHRSHILKMDADLIGTIPMRVGIDADAQIYDAYAPIAAQLHLRLHLNLEPVHA